MKKDIRDYRGAIFDLDGTLIDSMHVWDHLCRDWLLAQGKNPEADLERDIETMTVTQSAEYVRCRYGFTLSEREIIARWEGMALGAYETTVALKKETAALARELYGRGRTLAVVTSCFPAACEAVLRRHGLRDLFSAVLYTDEAPRDKSFPDIWIAAARRLGLEPASCIVFEDACYALRGVRAAGMAFAAVYDDTCTEWELMKAEADWVFGPKEFYRRYKMEQPEASLAIQVLPKTAKDDEVLRIVDAVIAYIKNTGLTAFVGPFETTLEGGFDELMEIAKECQLICIREGAEAVSAYIKIAYNPTGGVWSIDKKVAKHHH